MLQPTPDVQVFALYPLIPWVGVMAAGYALGPVFLQLGRERRAHAGCDARRRGDRWLRRAARANLYGDPQPWAPQDGLAATVLSFLNCEKYPPSLLYLMMTLGPALMLLALVESARGQVATRRHDSGACRSSTTSRTSTSSTCWRWSSPGRRRRRAWLFGGFPP